MQPGNRQDVDRAGREEVIFDFVVELFARAEQNCRGQTGTLVDAWQATHPTEPGYTFPAWEPARRIDYLWVPSSVRLETLSVVGSVPNRETISPSDHCGLLAVVKL